MTYIPTPALPQNPISGKAQISAATTWTTVFTGGGNGPGSKVTALIATSTDGSTQTLQVAITRSAVQYILGTFNIPISAGTVVGTPAVNLLDPSIISGLPIDNDGQRYILLTDSSDTLQCQVLALSGGKVINLNAIGANF